MPPLIADVAMLVDACKQVISNSNQYMHYMQQQQLGLRP
jgi:hypothetical protein